MKPLLGRGTWLFAPGISPELIAKAARSQATGVIIDLEDSVDPNSLADARRNVASFLAAAPWNRPICVRVNNSARDLGSDLAVAIHPMVSAIMIPKVESAERLRDIENEITDRAHALKQSISPPSLMPLIETPAGVLAAASIAAAPGVDAVAFGTEDFASAMGVSPSEELFTTPLSLVAIAAKAAGVGALGIGTSLRNFTDVEAFAAAATQARAMGMTGCLCIHPRQVEAATAAFTPTEAEQDWASRVIDEWTKRPTGVGAISVDGTMVDEPVIRLARTLLARH